MPAIYAQIARRAALAVAVVALVAIAVSFAVAGQSGLYGALLGVGVVTVFIAVSALAVGRAAAEGPVVMTAVAIVTYTLKILLLAVLVSRLRNLDGVNTVAFGLVSIVCILAWSVAQIVFSGRTRTLYFTAEQG